MNRHLWFISALIFATLWCTVAQAQTVAKRAADFQAIWGTAGHSCGSQACSSLANDIAYTGIKQWRDGIGTTSNQAYSIIAASGLKITALPWYTSGNYSDIPTNVANLQAMASEGILQAVEGWNEMDNWGLTYNGVASSTSSCSSGCTSLPVAQWTAAYYAAVKAALPGYPVYDLTHGGFEWSNLGLQYLTIPAGAGTTQPAGTHYADVETLHVYPQWGGHFC